MRIIRKSRLFFREGRSDRVYEVDLGEHDSSNEKRFVVNFRYGRRSSRLREGTKTVKPVDLAAATTAFASVVVAKINEGYQEAEPGDASLTPVASLASSDDGEARRSALLVKLRQAIAGRHKDTVLFRWVWRAGEITLREAAADIARLENRSVMGDYCVAWALGRIKSHETKSVLWAIKARYRQESAGSMAREALLDVATPDELISLTAEVKALLPPPLQTAIDHPTATLSECFLANLGTSTPATSDWLVALYWLSRHDLAIDQALRVALKTLPLEPNIFKGLRRIYKQAEYRFDGQTFGLLAHRVETTPNYWRNGSGSNHVWEGRKRVAISEALGKPNAKLAFSHRTRDYLRRRTARTLRRLGELDRDEYATMAAGTLVAFGNADAQKPRTVEQTEWRNVAGKWEAVPINVNHYDEYASYLAFNQILRGRSEQFKLAPSLQAWKFDPTLTESVGTRTEAFPAIWDRHPEVVLTLLEESRNDVVQTFCIQVLKANEPFLQTVSMARWVHILRTGSLLASDFAFQSGHRQFDPARPDIPFIVACLAAKSAAGRDFSRSWIENNTHAALQEPTIVFALVTAANPDVRTWGRSTVPHHRLSRSAAESLVGRLVALLMSTGSLSQDTIASDDEARISAIGWALTDVFAEASDAMSMVIVEDLIAHQHPAVRVQGAKLLKRRSLTNGALPGTLLTKLLDDEDNAVRAAGVAVLGNLSDRELAQHAPLITNFAFAESPEVRAAARPLLSRLCQQDARRRREIGDRLVDSLFRAEQYEGLHKDTITLLVTELTTYSETIDTSRHWRLLQAKSKGAHRFAEQLLPYRSPNDFSIKQLARLFHHSHLGVRQFAMQRYSDDLARVKAHGDDALKALESPWDDARTFGFAFFSSSFEESDWTPERIIALCDSVKPDVQTYGRELVGQFYAPDNGDHYLLKLAEHPSPNVELFVTNFLERHGTGEIAKLESLMPYFRSVLTRVNQGRAAKTRVLEFLKEQGLRCDAAARSVSTLLEHLSATTAVSDREDYINVLRELATTHTSLAPPFVVKTPPLRATKRNA